MTTKQQQLLVGGGGAAAGGAAAASHRASAPGMDLLPGVAHATSTILVGYPFDTVKCVARPARTLELAPWNVP
eukprot:COSAG06_NODE_1386_length_9618_cov_11.646917_3_plen_73_part_00